MAKPPKIKINYKDIERDIVEGEAIVTDTIDIKTQEAVIKQVNNEFNVAYPFNMAKRKKNLARLRLYNNQMRDDKSVGDPLLFTTFNTVHAGLYNDRLSTSWEGRGGRGDADVEDNLNALYEYDYDVMEKYILDYYWNWDAEFFGRGFLLMMEFDRSEGAMCPVPEHIDASTFIRDPKAVAVNGIGKSRKGAMRFGGWEVGATYYELKNLKGYFNVESLRKGKETPEDLTDELREAVRTAQNLENFPAKDEELGKYESYEFRLLNWCTCIKGEKYLVTLGNNRTTLHRMVKLNFKGLWPIVDRTLYPYPSSWDGVSIPDLCEDKQRARAILLNIGMESAKNETSPSYLYDQTKIKNKNNLNFRINKFIPVDGPVGDAFVAAQKGGAHGYANLIMDVLDVSAQRATAATELRQGIQSKSTRTLGEQELAAAGGDTRFGMSARIYGWSERMFALMWYLLYKRHFKDGIDEKIVRIQGAMAPTWRPLSRSNIISLVDPDVKIESRVMSEAKRQREREGFNAYLPLALNDPTSNKRFLQREGARLNGLTKEKVNLAFPPTVDEIQAEDENILLNNNKLPPVSVNDDHLTHIDIHSKAEENAYTKAHILAHKKLMIVKRNRTDLFAPPEGLNVNVDERNNAPADAPLNAQ